MLEVGETFQTRFRNSIQFTQIAWRVRVCCRRTSRFDASEDLVHRRLRSQTQIAKRLRRNHRRQEAAHRLFSAAVGILDQVRQRVEHRCRHARGNLDRERGRVTAAFFRNIELDRDTVAAHLSRSRDKLLDAMFEDGERLLHRIGILSTACLNLQLRFARMSHSHEPIDSCLAVSLHFNRSLRDADLFTINEQTSN